MLQVRLGAIGWTECSCCGRPLTDPDSVRAGMGPICRAKRPAEEQSPDQEQIRPRYWGPLTPEDLPARPYTKVYFGKREIYGRVVVEDAGATYPLQHIVYHSPTGMEWGYSGSGPSDLARSILADVAGIRVADTFYQEFKQAIIASLPQEGFRLPEADVRAWLAAQVGGEGS